MDDETRPAPAPPRRRVAVVLAALAAVAAVLVVTVAFAHDGLARRAIASFAHGAGYDVAFDQLHVGTGSASADGVRVRNLRGEPVFDARHVDLAYSLRDLLPGGKRRFGLKSVDVSEPHLTLIHHRDGSYNVSLPKPSNAPARPNTTPIDVRIRVRGGSVDIIDRFVNPGHEKHDRIAGVRADATLSPVGRSYYDVAATLLEDGGRYPIAGRAKLDDSRGYEFQHWTAARLPVAALTNFVLPNHAVMVDAGDIVGLDAKIAGLLDTDKLLHFHMGIVGRLEGGRLAVASLDKPIRDARGPFVVYDDGVSVPGLDATIDGTPVRLRGALYHFAAPQIRFALTGSGELAHLKNVSRQVAKLPLHGALAVEGLAEGTAGNPVVLARFASARIAYGNFVFEKPHGLAAIQGQRLDVISSNVRYGAIDLNAHASVDLQRHVRTEAMLTAAAPADGIPYAGSIAPGMQLGAVAVASGIDGNLATRGALRGSGVGSTLESPFSVDGNGVGTIGPIALDRADGSNIFARVRLDRRANDVLAVVHAHGLSLHPAAAASLPGFTAPPVPRIDGRLDADLAGAATGSTISSAGGSLHAYGSWGDVNAIADGSAGGLAATGRYRGSFERLTPFTGNVGAHGGIDLPFAAIGDGTTTTVQVAGARFDRASVRGIPIERADATVTIRPRALDVIAATLRVAQRDVTAQGSFGNGGEIRVTAGDLDVRDLGAANSPLKSGTATALAIVGGTFAHPTGRLLVALSGGRYQRAAVTGDAALAYRGRTLRIDDATVGVGGAFARASGSVTGLGTPHTAPRYDVRAALRDADIASLAGTVKTPLRYPEGTLNADLRVGGAGSVPTIAGDVGIPEGSLNGLSFRDAHVSLSGTAAALSGRNGSVTVGGSQLRFGGTASRTHQHVAFAAPRLNLADFNDYFDEADVLAGTGAVAMTVDASPSSLAADGDVALRGTRFRRFALGDATASVRTSGATVRTVANVNGANGRIALNGSATLPARNPLRDTARRSYLDLQTRVAGVQLGTVLPAAGISAPLVGRVDGAATVRGRYPALALTMNASLSDGIAGRVPIQRLTLAASVSNGRGRVTDATLVTSALTARGGGTFGLRPRDPLAVTVDANSPDIGALALLATGKNPGVHGALAVKATVRGTAAQPQLASTADVHDLSYDTIAVPSVHADIAATRSAIDVRNGSAVLQRGSVAFDGHVPFGRGASTPVAFDFAPRGVDVAPYSRLLPDHGVLAGLLDGNVGVRGTLANPQLSGGLDFHNGSFHSDSFKGLASAITLQLSFAGTRAQIDKLHVHLAPGNIDGSGVVAVGDLRDPAKNVSANVALRASNALVNAPKFFVGFLDGNVSAQKAAGARTMIGGDITASSARVPYQAFLPTNAKPQPNAPAPPDIGFNLAFNVGKDVRVTQGPVDIGAAGSVLLGGTLAKPTLDGQFTSTDGIVSFYRTFTLQPGSTVAFDPSNGIIPSLDATATTRVPDPPTDVILRITGLATALNLDFASDPQYSKEQIVGLLVNAQALGAVSGVAQTSPSASNGPSPIAGITEGFINQQFANTFLKPLSTSLGGALGLQDLQLSYGLGGSVSAVARRLIGHKLALTYGETFGGQTPRQTLGLSIGGEATSAQLSFYNSGGGNQAFGGQALTPFLQSGFLRNGPINYTLQAAQPPNGSSGFIFTFQKRFP